MDHACGHIDYDLSNLGNREVIVICEFIGDFSAAIAVGSAS
jgi:hypothetical protein